MRPDPKENEVYRHFKGNLYQIVTLATHSETRETLVIYRALYGEGGVYARPLDMFMSEVDKQKYPEVTQQYRFEKTDSLLDPGLMEFLDAETFEERIKILAHLRPRITDSMINTMAVSLDLDIKDGKLVDYYDSEAAMDDELLNKYLAKNKQAVLSEIIATIQKEQNEIIRLSPKNNLIVQGVAGSGKTTVATENRESGAAPGSHASPRPHVRSAHWHTYWTGPRDAVFPLRKPVMRWIPPLPIGMDWKREMPTIIRMVGG